jgi:cysteine protease ATG4
LKLTELKQFAGIMGGKPNQALYFIGKQEDSFIFLDPHYVQLSVSKVELASKLSTYFCDYYRLFNSQSIDSSLAICFYLRNPREAKDLCDKLIYMQECEKNDFFINVMDKVPDYLKPGFDYDKFFKSFEKSGDN